MFYIIFFSFYIISIMNDDRILKETHEPVYEDDLEIFFSDDEREENISEPQRRFVPISNDSFSSYSPSSFRSSSISPPYTSPRRSPSSRTFISNEFSRGKREEMIKGNNMEKERTKRKEKQRRIIRDFNREEMNRRKSFDNATKRIQSAYRKHLSKKNKGYDCCTMMGGKKNEKDCGCEVMGGKRKTKRRWSRKYKKSINCRNPKGFSQKQYCKYGRKKSKRSKKMRGGGWRPIYEHDNPEKLYDYVYGSDQQNVSLKSIKKRYKTYEICSNNHNEVNNTVRRGSGLGFSTIARPCHDAFYGIGKDL